MALRKFNRTVDQCPLCTNPSCHCGACKGEMGLCFHVDSSPCRFNARRSCKWFEDHVLANPVYKVPPSPKIKRRR